MASLLKQRNPRPVSLAWLRGVPEDKQEGVIASIKGSTILINKLLEILDEEKRALDRGEQSLSDFEDPSWGYKQAYRNGSRSTLSKIEDLFNF